MYMCIYSVYLLAMVLGSNNVQEVEVYSQLNWMYQLYNDRTYMYVQNTQLTISFWYCVYMYLYLPCARNAKDHFRLFEHTIFYILDVYSCWSSLWWPDKILSPRHKCVFLGSTTIFAGNKNTFRYIKNISMEMASLYLFSCIGKDCGTRKNKIFKFNLFYSWVYNQCSWKLCAQARNCFV